MSAAAMIVTDWALVAVCAPPATALLLFIGAALQDLIEGRLP